MKCNRMFPDVCGIFFRPSGACASFYGGSPTPYGVGCILPPLRGCVCARHHLQVFRAGIACDTRTPERYRFCKRQDFARGDRHHETQDLVSNQERRMRQLRRSERMQPTAQAVGSRVDEDPAPEGRKKIDEKESCGLRRHQTGKLPPF